jgi:multiple sugar transport system permease protein
MRRTTLHNAGGVRFALPWILGFVLLYAIPLISATLIACTSWDGLTDRSMCWIGIEHFKSLFDDRLFCLALQNSFAYAAINVPCQLVVALGLAMLVRHSRRRGFWATLFYVPHLLAGVATILIWLWLLNPQVGPINRGLRSIFEFIGLNPVTPPWLYSATWARPSLVFMNLWYAGGPMLIFLAALLRSGNDVHDAARLDGATCRQRFIYITLPQISPTILFNALTLFVISMHTFEKAFLMFNWQQENALLFSSVYMYQTAFERHRFAYALAQGLALLCMLGLASIAAVVLGRRFVVYDFEEAND